uniref:Uncharacterized protein n=1 Tax=Arundo donax TaxID=35708 RepID=A0A0A9CPV1_ARUDO
MKGNSAQIKIEHKSFKVNGSTGNRNRAGAVEESRCAVARRGGDPLCGPSRARPDCPSRARSPQRAHPGAPAATSQMLRSDALASRCALSADACLPQPTAPLVRETRGVVYDRGEEIRETRAVVRR